MGGEGKGNGWDGVDDDDDEDAEDVDDKGERGLCVATSGGSDVPEKWNGGDAVCTSNVADMWGGE